ncbi:hypothetical protein [Elizabethkingia anophelis]|uniref:hypothetical protein n=1 Tax=Elizabethkingia anophelis TaxID=1117645 RepID=UPI0038921196
MSIFKSDDIQVDGANILGIIVGILAFLVTLLIGFQIYKSIEVEEAIEKKMSSIENRMIETLKTVIDVQIESKMEEYKRHNKFDK